MFSLITTLDTVVSSELLKPVTDAPGSLGPCDDGVSKAPVGSNTKTGRYGPFVSGTGLDADRFAVGALTMGE